MRDSASNSGSDSTIVSNNNSIGSSTNDSNNGSGSASIGNSDDDKYDTPQQYIYPRWILLNNVKFLKDLIKDSLLGSFDKLWTEKITTANGTKTLGPQLLGTLINTPDFKSQFCNKLILKIPHSIINQLVQVQIKNIVTPAYLHMQSQSKIPKIIREHVDEKFMSEFLEKNKLNICEKIKEKFMTSHFGRSKIQEICSDRIGAAIANHVDEKFISEFLENNKLNLCEKIKEKFMTSHFTRSKIQEICSDRIGAAIADHVRDRFAQVL